MIFIEHCRVRFQCTDGKGTKFESINLSQSSNTNNFFFRKERERAKVSDQEKLGDVPQLRSIGLARFSGQTRITGGCFPGILSSSF